MLKPIKNSLERVAIKGFTFETIYNSIRMLLYLRISKNELKKFIKAHFNLKISLLLFKQLSDIWASARNELYALQFRQS